MDPGEWDRARPVSWAESEGSEGKRRPRGPNPPAPPALPRARWPGAGGGAGARTYVELEGAQRRAVAPGHRRQEAQHLLDHAVDVAQTAQRRQAEVGLAAAVGPGPRAAPRGPRRAAARAPQSLRRQLLPDLGDGRRVLQEQQDEGRAGAGRGEEGGEEELHSRLLQDSRDGAESVAAGPGRKASPPQGWEAKGPDLPWRESQSGGSEREPGVDRIPSRPLEKGPDSNDRNQDLWKGFQRQGWELTQCAVLCA